MDATVLGRHGDVGMVPAGGANRFAIAPSRIAMALLITVFSAMNSLLGLVQWLLFGRKVAGTEIQGDPIFVIGHWRSGTTLLHELLVLDERHTYSDTFACFCPKHFLVSGWFFRPLLRVLLPARRPMDNMEAGWDRPQEDEFALCNMGSPSPYLTIAFPNRPPQDQEYFDLERLSPQAQERWKRRMVWFLKCVTVWRRKRIVLKSPPHTFRIKVLLELFPNARFVHIIRDPHVIFPSTMKLWKCLHRDQGLQVPHGEGLEEHVFETFNRMYEVFERDRRLIAPARLCEVRYEDLVEDPIGQMRAVYERLELGEFDCVLPALQSTSPTRRTIRPIVSSSRPSSRRESTAAGGRSSSATATPSGPCPPLRPRSRRQPHGRRHAERPGAGGSLGRDAPRRPRRASMRSCRRCASWRAPAQGTAGQPARRSRA